METKNHITLSMNLIKHKVLAILVVMLFTSILHAQVLGDYRNKWGWGLISNPVSWSYFDGTNWVDAIQGPPSPFQNTLYLDHTAQFDRDFILEGTIEMAPSTELIMLSGFDLTIAEDATARITKILVNKDATLINHGEILSCVCGAIISLAAMDNTGLSAVLINMGTIELQDDGNPSTANLDLQDGAKFISGAGAYVYGTGSIVTTAQQVRFEIANTGGYDDAFRLTGDHHLEQAHYLFNGTEAQITGNIGSPLRSLTVANPAGLTMQKNLTLNPWESSLIWVKSGSTLNMGPYIIESSDWGNASFILEPGGTLNTAHPEGISSDAVNQKIAYGAMRTNTASYSSAANYVFSGSTLQQSGNFITQPDAYTVNNLSVTNTAGLVLTNPLTINGNLLGGQYIQGDYTLPVTLSSFTAVALSGGTVRVQWSTSSETNVLGYYVLRSEDGNIANAIYISPRIGAANSSQGSTYLFEDRELQSDGTYYYWLEDIGIASDGEVHGPLRVIVRFEDEHQTPEIALAPGLNGNYPNPFNPSSTLRFTLPQASDAVLTFYNRKGQVVDKLILQDKKPGNHQIVWNTQSLNLPSGIYYVRLQAMGLNDIMKLTLSK